MSTPAIQILASHFPERDWLIRTPAEGCVGECYVATDTACELFIKLDVDVEVVRRASELGIAPPVIVSGACNGRPYVVQEYICGTYPDRTWFSQHLPQLAILIEEYHRDPGLRSLLTKNSTRDHGEHITTELRGLEAQTATLPENSAIAELPGLFDELRNQASCLDCVELVPAHPDPHSKNFLVAGDKAYLLDWDGAVLSDPLRDVGPLLWWYVPPQKWPKFFSACSIHMNEQITRQVYWWAARQSCDVALWLAARGRLKQAKSFIIDFRAALHRQANPHA